MPHTTYYKDKVYLPREVRDALGLTEGDELRIEVTDADSARLLVERRKRATRRVLERLDKPPSLGEPRRVGREEIYEGVA